jgi:hypothetical protein
MAHVGYALVSLVGKRLEVQLDKLRHCDKLSGILPQWALPC